MNELQTGMGIACHMCGEGEESGGPQALDGMPGREPREEHALQMSDCMASLYSLQDTVCLIRKLSGRVMFGMRRVVYGLGLRS